GIQLFMNSYGSLIFFETPSERRQGRAVYLISGWLIVTFYTIGACSDMSRAFHTLLEASNGLDYLQINSYSAFWVKSLSAISLGLVFLIGDGLLLYRCHLLLAAGWRWLLVLPALMYLSAIALHVSDAVLILLYSERMRATITRIEISLQVLSITTNVLMTSILCYRLFSAHRKFATSMPLAGGRLAVYRTAIRILVESALPLTVAGITNTAMVLTLFSTSTRSIASYVGDPKAMAVALYSVSLVYSALQALAPQMIIFRVATGRSWAKTNKSSAEALSRSLAFGQSPQPEESHITGQFARDDDEITPEERRPDPETL
ncbi:hypothetical protein FA15DRAFT_603124, partial [Coprinopsis marcescibilis]